MRVINNVSKTPLTTVTRRVQNPIGVPWATTNTWIYPSETVLVDYVSKSDILRSPRPLQGWRSPLPYSVTDLKETPLFGVIKQWSNGPNYLVHKDFSPHGSSAGGVTAGSVPWPSPTIPSWLADVAVRKALVKLKNQNINYAVAAAESRQTLGLLGSSLHTLANAYSYARRGKWSQAAGALGIKRHDFKSGSNEAAKRWLELQYGWLPLTGDVFAAFEELRGLYQQRDPVICVKAMVKEKIVGGRVKGATGLNFDLDLAGVYSAFVRLDYTVVNPGLKDKSANGLQNPYQIAWELVPFSFLIDWAYPIGEWISTWDADMGLAFKGGSLTQVVRYSGKASVFQDGGLASSLQPGASGTYIKQEATRSYFSMNRSVYTQTPWTIPRFKNPLSGSHVATALALLRTGVRLH